MARLISIFWTTDGIGDGIENGYVQDQLTRWQRMLWLSSPTTMGIATGYLNELEVTASDLELQVNTGACMAYGFPAWLLTAATHTLEPSTISDTGWRMVIRIKWDKRTMETVLLQNTGGVIDIPEITQDVGICWEVSLAYGIVSPEGIVTINDDRAYMSQPGEGIGSTMVADDTIEAINIQNRERTFWCDALSGIGPGATEPAWQEGIGWEFVADDTTSGYGAFTVPDDFTSDLKIRAVIVDSGGDSGTIRIRNNAQYGQGVDYSTYLGKTTTETIAAPATTIKAEVTELEPTPIIGDFFLMEFDRYGDHEDDTSTDTIYFLGWIIEYQADS